MGYIIGEARNQIELQPMCLDDYMASDNICRVIDAFCESLDMKELGFAHSVPSERGRPPYDPKVPLKLYLYGYLNRISSSGQLVRETKRNMEVMWLLEKQQPSKRTLCYFKAHNAQAIAKVFREFNMIYRKLELFGAEVIAVDSVKIRANNAKRHNYSRELVSRRIRETEADIAGYLAELEANDGSEADEPELSAGKVAVIVEQLEKKRENYAKLDRQLEESGESEISTIDGDSRMMRQGSGKGPDVSYNTQVVTDGKNKMIVGYDTTNQANDFGHLLEMTEKAKSFLCVKEITALADSGYYNTDDILKCEDAGTTCLVPPTAPGKKAPDVAYDRSNFTYDAEKDVYVCPEGQSLPYMSETTAKNGRKVRQYRSESVCCRCPNRERCTKSAGGRTVTRAKEQNRIDAINRRYAEGLEEYRQRQAIVEHAFGTIKWVWGFNRYQTRGFAKVGAENALIFCAYNLRRAVNILGTKKLLEAIAAARTVLSDNLNILLPFFCLRTPLHPAPFA